MALTNKQQKHRMPPERIAIVDKHPPGADAPCPLWGLVRKDSDGASGFVTDFSKDKDDDDDVQPGYVYYMRDDWQGFPWSVFIIWTLIAMGVGMLIGYAL